MSLRRIVAGIGCLAALLAIGPAAGGGAPLRLCLQSDDPPLSVRGHDVGSGFDVDLSRMIAERLGRTLAIQWFVTRDDPDSSPPLEANALLSDGRCDLVADYPLIADQLGRPQAESGKLPPFTGAGPDDRRRWVWLGTLAGTRPYRFDGIAVVLSPAHREQPVRKLSDIAALKLGVEIHSLADLIAMSYQQGRLADQVAHFDDSAALFSRLESGGIDAGLVDLRELDAWRVRHPSTRVTGSGYIHSIGFNMGFVGPSSSNALIAAVNPILSDLLDHGRLAALAKADKLTYLQPRSPDVSPGVALPALFGD